MPDFIKFDVSSNLFNINPSINTKTGIYKINVMLTDSMQASNTYSFNVEVMSDENYYYSKT